MKKNVFVMSTLAVVALALFSCAKVESDVKTPLESKGIPFEIVASAPQTKTTNDGLSTVWAEGDEVNVFHAVAGSTDYVNDGKFTVTDAANGKFGGTLASALDPSESYDWYVFYPYSSHITTPANTSASYTTVAPFTQSQTGNDNKAHLGGRPLAGKSTTAAGVSKPTVSMNQMAAVIKVVVTNTSGADLPVTQLKFTAPVNIAGSYYVNFVDPTAPVFTEKEGSVGTTVTLNTAVLSANSSTSTYYLAVKPFIAANGSTMKVKVNNYEKSLILDAAKTFTAGIIYNVTFNYNEAASVATLPFSIDGTGGNAAYSTTPGMSSSGVSTSDYAESHSPYLAKFDSNDDYVQVRFNEAAASASIGVKKIGGATNSSFDVMGSADGITFTKIETLNVTGDANTTMTLETSSAIDDSYRYIRFVFKKGANVGVGPITISKPSTAPAIIAANVSNVPVTGGAGRTLTYTIENFAGADDVAVTAFDGSVVTAAEVTSAGTVTYTVAKNYNSAAANGSITLYSANEDVTKVITVAQLGDSFATTATANITLAKTEGSTTFTITTPSYGWSSTVTPETGMNLTISPISGSSNASAQTITINSTTAAAASEQTLGTIVLYRDGNTSDPQKITVTVKKAASSGKVYTKVASVTSGKTYIIVSDNHVMNRPGSSAGTIAKTDVTVTSSTISQSDATKACEIVISTASIQETTCYLLYWEESEETRYVSSNGNATSLKYVVNAPTTKTDGRAWTIAATTTRGSFTINSNSNTNRSIRYRAGTTNKFGNYTSDTGEYYNVDLYELGE